MMTHPTETDPRLAALAKQDPVMKELIARVGPYRIARTEGAWEALASAVVFQQVSGRAAASICRKIKSNHEGAFPSPRRVVGLSPGTLRAYGMTERKEATLRALAQAIEDGKLNLGALREKHESVLMDALTRFQGVGRWTVQMYMVFHLGREDVFMPGDLGLRKAMANLYAKELALLLGDDAAKMPSVLEAETFARRWQPYRTVASWYLWRSNPEFPEPGLG